MAITGIPEATGLRGLQCSFSPPVPSALRAARTERALLQVEMFEPGHG
jgi:hypothetical protein